MIIEVPFGTKIQKAPYTYSREFMVQEHNYYCGVCKENSAVADCDSGILQPCWECQKLGYVVVKINWLIKILDKLGLIK